MTDDMILPTNLSDWRYLSDEISVFASPGEYESGTFCICALRDLKQVTVQAEDLKSGNRHLDPGHPV